MNKSVCFFVRTKDLKVLEDVKFYADDIKILKDLGYEIHIANSFISLLKARTDIYFVWWWTYAFMPMIFAKIRHKPILITGTFNINNGFKERNFFEKKIIKFSLKKANANIFVSKYEFTEMKKYFNGDNFFYVPHIVDENYHKIDKPIFPKDKFLLSVSWLQQSNYERKCIDANIKAIALIKEELKDYKYIIVGRRGLGFDKLLNLTKSLDLEDIVEFRGHILEEEKIQLMKTCALFISPTHYEGFGLAMLEAISSGAVVVTTKVAAVPYVLDDIAIYVRDNTPLKIAKKILFALNHSEIIKNKAQQGIIHSKKYYSYKVRLNGIKKIIIDIVQIKNL